MEFIETKNQSNILSPRVKKAMGSFITWALLAQSYLGYGAIRPTRHEKVITISTSNQYFDKEEKTPKQKDFFTEKIAVVKEKNIDSKYEKESELSIRKKEIKKNKSLEKRINKNTVTYKSTHSQGTIGHFGGQKLDNPTDNRFHILITQRPTTTDEVWLEYELKGVTESEGVSKSINDQLATGGYLVKKNTEWTHQREAINPEWLVQGDNQIQFTLPEEAEHGYQVKNVRVVIEPSINQSNLIINTHPIIYDSKIYIQGFVKKSSSDVQVYIDGKNIPHKQGVFESILEKQTLRPVEVKAIYSNGTVEEKILEFTKQEKADYSFSKEEAQSVSKHFIQGVANRLQMEGAELEVKQGYMQTSKNLSITALRSVDIPALDMGMINTTKAYKGYRFLPHGEHFKEEALVKIHYDRTKIPNGYTENDIQTYYFDTNTHHWVALKRDSIDKKNQVIISKTTHFTDMINGVIQTPESPESQGFAPTTMSDIKAVDPTAKVQVMAAPSANQRGSATTSYSFEMPPARNGMAPSLGIQYNSDGGSGWLGEGWDLNVPSITVDTRWGVPRYSGDKETETYSFNGTMLAMLDAEGNPVVAHRGDQIGRVNKRRFYPRKEGGFSKIVRKGDGFGDTTWEVTDKKGTVYTYGKNGGKLTGTALEVGGSEKEVIVEWRLSRIEELHGDWIEYEYGEDGSGQVEEKVKETLKSNALYLTKVTAGINKDEVLTQVLFTSNSEKERKTNSARYGFLTSSHKLLDRVDVEFIDRSISNSAFQRLRSYTFDYDTGAFSKKRLKTITQLNSSGEEFNHHEMEYYNDVAYTEGATSYTTFGEEKSWEGVNNDIGSDDIIPTISDNMNGKVSNLGGSKTESTSGSMYLGVGIVAIPDMAVKTGTIGGSFSYSNNKTKGLLSFIDINGDGLPDKVIDNGGYLAYRPNLSTIDDTKGRYKNSNNKTSIDNLPDTKFGDLIRIEGISDFSESKSNTTSAGGKANIGFSVVSFVAGVDVSKTRSKVTTYFSDVNGDGLPDIVKNGQVFFNHIAADGITPTFTPTSADTPSPINATGSTNNIDKSAFVIDPAEQEELIKNSPLYDVVRVWEAPFNGTINIQSKVTLLNPNDVFGEGNYDEVEYKQADGVHVVVEFKEQNLISKVHLTETSPTTTMNKNNIQVTKGDKIYFRLQSGIEEKANGAFDQVDWDPVITYIDNKHHTGNNPDTQKSYSYEASEGYVVDVEEPFIITPKEKHATAVKLEGQFTKPITSDVVSVQVYKVISNEINGELVTDKQLKWCKTFQPEETSNTSLTALFELDPLEEGENIHNLKIEFNSDTNIEWNAIQWDARMTQYDRGNYESPRIIYVGNDDDLAEVNQANLVDGYIRKTVQTNEVYDAYITSNKAIQNGYISATVESDDSSVYFGLNPVGRTGTFPSYMVMLSPDTGKMSIYGPGNPHTMIHQDWISYKGGDEIKLEIEEGNIRIYQNGNHITSPEIESVFNNVPVVEYELKAGLYDADKPTAHEFTIVDYDADDAISCDGSSTIENLSSPDGEETYPYIDYGIKAEHAIEGTWYTVQNIETDKVSVRPNLIFTDTTKANGSVVLSIKDANEVQLLSKQEITYVNGVITPSVTPIEIEAKQGDKLWIEYTTEDVDFVNNINQQTNVSDNIILTEIDTPLCITTPELNLSGQHTNTQTYEAITINSTATVNTAIQVEYKGGRTIHLKPGFNAESNSSGRFHAFIDESNCGPDVNLLSEEIIGNVFTNIANNKFGPMYRHWGQFVYNASAVENGSNTVMKEATLEPPNENNIDTDALGDINMDDNFDPNSMQTSPLSTVFMSMTPDPIEKEYWYGGDDLTYIKAPMMSASRLGQDDVIIRNPLEGLSVTELADGLGCYQGTGAFGINLESKSESTVNMTGSGMLTTSTATGNATTLSSFQDMNGDRYPDIITQNTIQVTNSKGAFDGTTILNYIEGNHYSTNSSESVSLGGGSVPSSSVTAATANLHRTVNQQVNNIMDGGDLKGALDAVEGAQESLNKAKNAVGVSGNVGVSWNHDETVHSWIDINGDGLVDKILKNKDVQLNLGYQFSERKNWGLDKIQEGESTPLSLGLGVDYGSSSISVGLGLNKSTSLSNFTLKDMNSDGLVDKVSREGNQIKVYLNNGNGFESTPTIWGGISKVDESSSTGGSINGAFTITPHIPLSPAGTPMLKIAINPSGSLGRSISRTHIDIKDVDGDGFMDFVSSDDEGELNVRFSTIARTNKLKTVHNPLGGSYTVDYAKSAATYDHPNGKWVMSSVTVDDGIHDDGPNMQTAFRYGKGKYDRHEREFLGFGKVMAESLDENGAVYRTATQEFDVSDYYKAGNITASYLEDKNGKKYTESTNEYYVYSVKDTSAGDQYTFSVPTTVDEETNKPTICSDRGIGFTPMKYAEAKAYEGTDNPATLTQSFYKYYLDNHFGDLKSYKYSDKGTLSNTGSGSYNYMTSIEYKAYDDDTIRIYGLPTRVTVTGQSGNIYRQTKATYEDGYANHITQVRQQLNGTDWAETDIEYDRYGNITKKTLPANANGKRMWYQYRYDRDYDMYVERIDDAFEYRTEFENYDYRYGIPLLTRDYNDYEIHKTIDEYGRLKTVTGPNELANGKDYTITFEYHPIAEVTQNTQPETQNQIIQPAYAITKHYDEEHPEDDLETVTFVDGIGRAVQVKKDGKITDKDNPTYSEHGLIVSGRAKFDAYGRVAEAYYPSWEHGFDLKTSFNTTFDEVTPTKTIYDVLDRAVVTTLPDGAQTKMTYTTDNSTLLKTEVEDAEGGKKASFTNGSGLTMKVEEYSGPEGTITTTYAYNPINELLKVTDVNGNEITSTYDRAGRRTSVTHPDAGTSTFIYDTASNLVEKQTANLAETNEVITYDYDLGGRLLGVNYPQHPENNVKYYYGNKHANHNRIGRLVLQEDASGAQEFYYGRLGELTEVRRTLIVPNNAIATYVTKWRYDSWNRLQEMIYPDEEKITYGYNSGGLLESVKGEKTYTYNYVNKLGYDKFEQRTYLKYCNGSETKYTYEDTRRRLSNLSVWDGTGYQGGNESNQIMNNTYTYDQVSNVLKVQNSASAYASSVITGVTSSAAGVSRSVGGSMTHEYTYDGLYRLKTGTGTFTGGNGKTASYTLNMAYDNLHNITAKSQQVEQSGIMFDGVLKSGYDLTYAYNAERPHQMATVADENYRTEGTDTQNAKLETHNYQYDANGNLIYINTAREKEDEHVEDKMRERKLLWDEENRLEAISENGYVSNYWYDASGERTVKTYGDGEGVYVQSAFAGGRTGTTDFTLYVSPYMVVRNGGSYTKHIYMGGQRIVSKLGDLDSYGEDPRRIEYAGSEAEGQNGESIMPDYKAKYQLSYEVMKARYDSLEVPYHGTDNDDYLGGTGFCCDPVTSSAEGVSRSSRVAENESPELYQYYYHSDHLGSSSYITNLYGEVAQHVEYVPFGEVFIEERNNTWNTPYLFNGKELDEETGLYYYGARYYNPRVSQWLSVDPPIFDVYLDGLHNRGVYNSRNLGVYMYTYNNPVTLIDPNGLQTRYSNTGGGMYGGPQMQQFQYHMKKAFDAGFGLIDQTIIEIKSSTKKVITSIKQQFGFGKVSNETYIETTNKTTIKPTTYDFFQQVVRTGVDEDHPANIYKVEKSTEAHMKNSTTIEINRKGVKGKYSHVEKLDLKTGKISSSDKVSVGVGNVSIYGKNERIGIQASSTDDTTNTTKSFSISFPTTLKNKDNE